jgi:hypothetical protein
LTSEGEQGQGSSWPQAGTERATLLVPTPRYTFEHA